MYNKSVTICIGDTVSKNTYINVRVDEKTKKDVEDILEILGINMSTAIDVFLNQIILNKGLPFKEKWQVKILQLKNKNWLKHEI